ncbi:DUF456 domain-containing protein [Parabacteroides gordonii]|jgi:uncharacterized protein YqgC (DUF456 family)|uniref:DUF456 domain-containing protein n=1 Tax=Parabacteroides gordonii MS-1 = DSM 23371 TaxID=1203610 RepID=A0A0F5JP52_9BACT|nr:DUF456 domain-containing protein [Parabacteroides gordonii]KKB59380.1 hypothetical protein HMPREF1536_00928 [Parabacteroides gordonii MS-1 = DSM 23371]MCA5583664.1 DUF456 domain-containing protein [Parabacteroides gordonii]RGP14999.1 DUF456 domain-containing protein [Parabacteroides gordonii]
MDILLYVLAGLCLLLGFAGCFLPVLPGPPMAYVGLLLLQATERFQFTVGQLVTWGILVVVAQVLDYVTPILGTKYSGGSRWGNWGCVIGTVAGIFLFAPWGILLGPFIGALIGELLGGKAFGEAMKAGVGAFIGFLVSVVLKVGLCGYFVYCVIW